MEWTNVRLPHGGPSVQPDGTVKLEVADVLPIYEEEQMPPESVIDSRVHFYYVVGHLGNPWYEYGRRMEETEQRFLAVTRQLSRVVEEIAPPSEPPETRLRKIYARVQQLRYIGFEPPRTEKEAKREGLTRNNSAEDILSHGYAYSNEPNLLFIALARAAGFNASFVEVSDRRKNIFTRDVPDPSQLGASIVLVQVNGKQLFLDPATRFCPFGLLPWFESDTDGVAWGRFRGEEIRVPPQQSASAVIERVAELALTADGNLEGHAEITYGGVEALDRRLAAIAEDEAGRRKLMEEEVKRSLLPGAHVEVTSMAGWDATDEPLRIKLSVKVESYAVASERRMFFPTGIFQAARGTIPSHNRVQPVYFEHTYQTKDRVTIEIPPNYVIEALPEELTVETKFGSYKVTRSGSNGKVTMEREAELNGYYFLPETYRSVWAYLVRIRNGDAENVVLHVAHNPKR